MTDRFAAIILWTLVDREDQIRYVLTDLAEAEAMEKADRALELRSRRVVLRVGETIEIA